MNTLVLVSENYPIRVATTVRDLFKNSYPKAINIIATKTGKLINQDLPIVDGILDITVTYAATEVFEENKSNYTLHSVSQA